MELLPTREKVVYLHGFASSPRSRKATVLGQKLRALGFEVEIPDLTEGNFEQLSISGQLRVIKPLVETSPVVLVGSSMGGYLAALAAARYPAQIQRVILLAPAFDLRRSWETRLGSEQMAAWKRHGSMEVYNYAAGRPVALGYHLMEDAIQFEGFPDFSQSALIIHGTRDPVVPISASRQFVKYHPNARLLELTSGHELTDVLEDIGAAVEEFLFAPK